MLKNIQLKIILIFSILGILLISTLGVAFGVSLKTNQASKTLETEEQIKIYEETMQVQLQNVKIVTIVLVVSYGCICIVIGVFVSKAILDPISRLIDSAPKIAAGENIEVNKNATDEISNAFSIMTNELRENLNEVNRQKRQIETILLHMTDGIIAFDMEGNIMHINPAATDLLKLNSKDNTFEKIFGKIKSKK